MRKPDIILLFLNQFTQDFAVGAGTVVKNMEQVALHRPAPLQACYCKKWVSFV